MSTLGFLANGYAAASTSGESGAGSTPVVEAQGISVRYDRARGVPAVLDDIDLVIRPGEIVGVQGPSGCGKSTLLRVLSTLERPTAGRLVLGGCEVKGPRRDGFVMPIAQNSSGALDPRWPIWRTITEPLMAGHRRPHPSTARRRSLAAERMSTVGLDAIDIDCRPGQLSGGQCQRVTILRALVASPRLLVADEPTAALDVSVAAGVLRLMSAAADDGVAILMASHDRVALQVLCNRVLEMRGGRTVEHLGQRVSPIETLRRGHQL
jgi:ABC-type dipeptide/oligopeptide/nickel transport system ATPase subunit